MGVGEKCAPGGEAIDVGGLSLGMTAEATDPVIEIVDGDEQDVRRLRRCGIGGKVGREE